MNLNLVLNLNWIDFVAAMRRTPWFMFERSLEIFLKIFSWFWTIFEIVQPLQKYYSIL